jgi:hypothetical protein
VNDNFQIKTRNEGFKIDISFCGFKGIDTCTDGISPGKVIFQSQVDGGVLLKVT